MLLEDLPESSLLSEDSSVLYSSLLLSLEFVSSESLLVIVLSLLSEESVAFELLSSPQAIRFARKMTDRERMILLNMLFPDLFYSYRPSTVYVLVNLNRTYHQKTKNGMRVRPDLYEVTRKSWKINKTRADEINYLLGVYKDVVRCVIKPTTKWIAEKDNPKRYRIEGVTDDKEGNALYLNKDTKAYPFGSGGAIRYVED